MKNIYQVDKIVAAGCQLDTAIELVLEERDLLSAAVLIHGGWNIAKDILVKKNIETSHTWLQEIWPDLNEREIFKRLNQTWNFSKHADKDPEKILQFSADYVQSALMLALHDFSQLSPKSKTMDTFELWFVAKNEKFYKENFPESFAEASKLFPGLAALTPKAQAEEGFNVINAFR